jgi:thymidylate synthase (FAD)
MKNWHTSPFEQVQLTFHTKMPIFVARQWVRHRTARLNEISGRYSIMKDEFYVPAAEHIRSQSSDNKQGRSAERYTPSEEEEIIGILSSEQQSVYANYQNLLEKNVARELARSNLPLSLYTEWYWQIDLHNLFHFLRLRMDDHAQYEIRAYAEVMAGCARAVAPLAFEAFEEYVLGSVSFSRVEGVALAKLLDGKGSGLEGKSLAAFELKVSKLKSARAAEAIEEPTLLG